MAAKRKETRARTRPHHTIVFEMLKAGIEVKDCTPPEKGVPLLLARWRDVIWWVVVHRSEPDLVWRLGTIGNLATTRYYVTVVADGETAVRKIKERRALSREQQTALGKLLLTGKEEFTQREVAEALSRA